MTDGLQAERTPAGRRRPPRRAGRRRPVGEPPPLPRDIRGVAWLWIGAVAALAVVVALGYVSGVSGRGQRTVDEVVARSMARIRADRLHRTAEQLHEAFDWTVLLIAFRWMVVVALLVARRWRHIAVFAGTVIAVGALTLWMPTAGPEGTGVVGHPSQAAAGLAVTLLGVVYGLAPRGPWRSAARASTWILLAGLWAVLLVTDQNTFTEVLTGLVIGIAVPFLAYRIFTPEAVFPVTYRRGKAAHLDVTGRRGEAIMEACRDQLGLPVARVAPFGLAGSGGSTPLRMDLEDGGVLFGKLYATSHLRADRWYKLGRTILYGALEDEHSFNSVRRMVEYEDHMLRYLRDHDVPTAEPIGFLELTPEREYVLVTGFVEGATEILDAKVDERVIRSGLDLIRSLWGAGVAHRDVKPSNLLVRDGEVILIDDAFCQVRPSPWRQSVDLANMLLTLALRSDPRTVYVIATQVFTPDEVAEAIAATHGVTIPSQLRTLLRHDDRNLVEEFRSLVRPGLSMSRAALKFVLSAPEVSVVIPGIKSSAQAEENAGESDGQYKLVGDIFESEDIEAGFGGDA
ncbi:MAG: hypothetical protein HY240_11500 [Actinobacteria bacterium]|nr:hypothetical protein [Actinomycetota bacterium]